LKKIEKKAIKSSGFDFMKLGFALLFMVAVMIYSQMGTGGTYDNHLFLTIAAMFGAYMAMNIGANDVANNVGPAVGSKALTLGGAILIAAIFEASGAFIAGGEVIKTIKKGIIDIDGFSSNTDAFIWAMMAALLAAAVWLNLATAFKAPVSTTHSIVGGVMGAGIAAAGFGIVSWFTMGKIAASWVISPVLGGLIAALFLYSIKRTILFKEDRVSAAKFWVPVYVAIMTWAFATYLTLKGLKKIWPSIVSFVNETFFAILPVTKKPSFLTASTIGVILGLIVYFIMKRKMAERTDIGNDRSGINALFTIPLIFSAALLSFAHGANDVANAIGPLAAISDAVMTGGISSKAGIPLWVMAVGAFGISIGLALYGPKLIKTVGTEITELDQMRAFSIAMAAALTVIIASQLGLPVSSTHIAVGGVFGVGFLREWLDRKERNNNHKAELEEQLLDEQKHCKALKQSLEHLEAQDHKTKEDYERIVELYHEVDEEEENIKTLKRTIKGEDKKRYVQREAVKKIVAAWIITVPATALLSSLIYFMIRGIFV
jgi:PiT family inorganic phosphate transporter